MQTKTSASYLKYEMKYENIKNEKMYIGQWDGLIDCYVLTDHCFKFDIYIYMIGGNPLLQVKTPLSVVWFYLSNIVDICDFSFINCHSCASDSSDPEWSLIRSSSKLARLFLLDTH